MSFDPNIRNGELASKYWAYAQDVDRIVRNGYLSDGFGSIFVNGEVILNDLLKDLEDHAELTRDFLVTLKDDRLSFRDIKSICRAYQHEMSLLNPVWFYESGKDTSKVFKIHGDAFHDEVATTETEGLAVRIVGYFNNPGAPVVPLESDEIPDNMFFTEGDDDDWDIYRRNEEDEYEEWLASVSTEYLAIQVCRLIGG